ncbi:solute carrier family 35 member [Lynx pardinus]|uniref:Oxysterol binding protein 2 n=3 Tax=Felinae TaxID=338152 RepID=A0A667H3Z7_LYNCA|nr:solute carrier family 35 member E4 isoform X2 [Puma concolor]XP_030192840.1 solute carrier family 35 member E4 [Lynx canadensis]XP_040319941.1 solute carrier family 35 member E4 [Puma yagouaroundi]XP_043415187.1 solute carrier family 35 member E4 [Prionailurus bengalensis]XP_045314288.1 solute carrier family 35 member E4 [Leopardus geoffroyi]XP_046944420.1 solute carrier family 35 member E4 [Lynx rufus]XP_047683502.1 solute carrier family 35 member E4 [Prionailurus viverrinus]VFV22088.1 s
MCRCPLEHHDGRMTSAEAVAVASGARVAGSPEWPPDTPQALGRPGRVRVAVAALVWLLAGASMSSLNKWIFTVHGFGRPLLLSALHMLAAALACRWGAQRPMPSRTRRQVLLLSFTFGTSMACGNVGLSAVPLDLAQLATTTTPLITLALSALLLGRRHHPLQFAAMGPLCLGAACSLAGELRTPPAGCGFLLAATCLRGLKSIQQSALLQEERLDAVTLLYATSLPSFCLLAGAALVLEAGVAPPPAPTNSHLWACILISCLLSVLYNLASFSLLALTSALTVHVLGNLTVVGNLILSRLLFGSRLSALSYVGIALTLSGMFLYHNCEFVASWAARRGLWRRDQTGKGL